MQILTLLYITALPSTRSVPKADLLHTLPCNRSLKGFLGVTKQTQL